MPPEGSPSAGSAGRRGRDEIVTAAGGTTLSLLVGDQLRVTTSPNPVVPGFPHLTPAGHEDIPALADLLGLRERAPTKAGRARTRRARP